MQLIQPNPQVRP